MERSEDVDECGDGARPAAGVDVAVTLIGAHPDDIEIAAGSTVARLVGAVPMCWPW